MVKSLILTCFCLSLLSGPAMGHEIGFGDQVLQPIIELQSLLALLAVGLLYRQQPEVPINRVVALLLGLGLTVGLSCKVYLNPAHSQAIFALGIAGLAGSLVALAYPWAIGALSIFILSLGVSIGTNLSFESTDWIDLTQSLLGAFVGAIAVLYVIATMTVPTSRVMHQISVRVAGSWVVASAIMVLTLEVRNLTWRPRAHAPLSLTDYSVRLFDAIGSTPSRMCCNSVAGIVGGGIFMAINGLIRSMKSKA